MTTNKEIEKAVKIVAEYMGEKYYEGKVEPFWKRYDQSIDSLVPVWKKLGLGRFSPRFSHGINNKYYCEIKYSFEDELDWEGSFCALAETIELAALLATAKCIEALRNERSESTGGLKNV